MPEMRKACGERRAVVKDELAGLVPLGYGFFKNAVFLPKL
jgi:hypothetical protein